jgi:TnpA family transposase
VARHRLNIRLIIQHWDDLLRVAGSLKTGAVGAIELMRSLQGKNRHSTLARAIAELGRIPKTLHLLDLYDDESYRRRITIQLNRGESRHSLARAVFHGQKGELRQRYREGQEDQLVALGLVLNMLVLWTTQYMDLALARLRQQGWDIQAEDVARLSPLGYRHVNLLGRYQFELSELVASGAFRPLRHPQAAEAEMYFLP